MADISSKIHPYVSNCTEFDSLKHLDSFINEQNIFCGTISTLSNIFYKCLKFDLCILVDANSVFEPLALGATLIADKFIMVDDIN